MPAATDVVAAHETAWEGLHPSRPGRKIPGPRSEDAMVTHFSASSAKRLKRMPFTPARVQEALKA